MVKVQLLVYDLSQGMASSMSQQILGMRIDGIWHTGVVVFNQEYYFGGGIQCSAVGAFSAGNGLYPAQNLDMGETTKTKQELEQFLRSINSRFTMATYDLLRNNCNNFSNEVVRFLTGSGIPSYIVDLPNIVFSTPGGAMLRPLIEGMQQNIQRQQGGGLDPFGGQASSTSQFLSQLTSSQSIQTTNSTGSFEAGLATSIQTIVGPAALEESSLVSNDGSAAPLMAKKILNAEGISENQKVIISNVLAGLSSNPPSLDTFTTEAFSILESLLDSHPSLQMQCLFILRLMVVHDQLPWSEISFIDTLITKLSAGRFNSPSSLIMAMCTLANFLAHNTGVAFVTSDIEKATIVVDISVAGFGHERAEVRQMSAALAYNYTLACTKEGKLSSLWANESGGELHPTCVTLMCGCIENIATESDKVAKKRKLSLLCRIMRAYGNTAAELARDLGLGETMQAMRSSLPETTDNQNEHAIINELVMALK